MTTRRRTLSVPTAVLGSPVVTLSDPRLADALGPFRTRLGETAVFCDFDGTLAPIVPRPEDARLLEGAREAVLELVPAARLVAFISGRGLADLESRVDIPGVAYAGNHGMELHRVGHPAEMADGVAEHIAAIAAFAETWPATRLEAGRPADGGQGRDPERPRPRRPRSRGRAAAARAGRLGGPRPRPGPDRRARGAGDPPAGRRWTRAPPCGRCCAGTGARAALYIGDDRTDADAWGALRALRAAGELDATLGVAVASGEVAAAVREAADVEVAGPPGALEVLRALLHA